MKKMELKEKLAELRSRRGLSQQDVAEALDVSRQAVSRWETGAAVPGRDSLLALLEVHSVTFVWVKGHASNPYNNRCDELAVSEWKALR